MPDNHLLYGDNLDFLRNHEKLPTCSVDLICLDPPFNSNADYNVIFREQSSQKSAAQIKAFTDTWHWDLETDRGREEILTSAPERVARMLDAMVSFLTLEQPTRDMLQEADAAGFYTSELWPGPHGDHKWPRLRIRTIEDLLAKRGFAIPPRPVQFKQAERVAAATPGLTAPGLWSEAPSALDIPEAEDDELDTPDEEPGGLE